MATETVLSLLKKSSAFLEEKGVGEARRSAELLLAAALNCTRLELYLRFEQPMREGELDLYRSMIRRRLAREPVQLILGRTEFYGLDFRVTADALIPRPETEHLVELAIETARDKFSGTTPRLLDIGAGSGAICVALACNLHDAEITAIDASAQALQLAAENASMHGVQDKIVFRKADVLRENPQEFGGPYHLVVSNPPYIPEGDISELQEEIRIWEPRAAYTDGADGLTFYRRYALIARELLMSGGCLLVEIGYGQSEAVRAIFSEARLGIEAVVKDYSGIDRVIRAG